jgi:type IV secretory pathway component VirB8
MFSVLSICFNMMLASTIYLMLPQLSVYPTFYSINDYFSQIEVVQKREVSFPVSDLITEKYIDEYLYLRFSVTDNINEMKRRWGEGSAFYWYQTPNMYSQFMAIDYPLAMMQAQKKKMQRYIEVQWIRPMSRGLWQAQFKTFDFLPDKPEPSVAYWRATMRITYANLQFQDKSKRVLNPYGFLVSSFSLAYHGAEGGAESYMETARKRSRGK